MVAFRMVQGSYDTVFKSVFGNSYRTKEPDFSPERLETFLAPLVASFEAQKDLLFQDLPRTSFVNGVPQFFHSLLGVPNDQYAQGDLDAGFLPHQLFFYHHMYTPEIAEEGERWRLLEAHQQQQQVLRLAYRNDEGVLCGFSITQHPDDSNTWVASVVRNPHLPPAQRETLVIASPSLFCTETLPGESVDASNVASTLMEFIKLKRNNPFRTLIQEDGALNKEQFTQLNNVRTPKHWYLGEADTTYIQYKTHFQEFCTTHQKALDEDKQFIAAYRDALEVLKRLNQAQQSTERQLEQLQVKQRRQQRQLAQAMAQPFLQRNKSAIVFGLLLAVSLVSFSLLLATPLPSMLLLAITSVVAMVVYRAAELTIQAVMAHRQEQSIQAVNTHLQKQNEARQTLEQATENIIPTIQARQARLQALYTEALGSDPVNLPPPNPQPSQARSTASAHTFFTAAADTAATEPPAQPTVPAAEEELSHTQHTP